MLIKGKHAILEALRQKQPILTIILSSQSDSDKRVADIEALATRRGIPVEYIRPDQFKHRFKEENTQHAVARLRSIDLLPFKTIIDNADHYQRVVVLDHIEDPFNFGAIIRTCATQGVDAIVYPKNRNATLSSGVHKASSGALYHVPLSCVSNISQSLMQLSKAGFWIYGSDSHAATKLADISVQTPFVLVMGNEHKGVSQSVRKQLHDVVKVEMCGKLDSLNVSVAAGILLYTFNRKVDAC